MEMVLKLISQFFIPYKCPFCCGKLSNKERFDGFYCVKCQTNFVEEVDEEGEESLEPLYPSNVLQASGTQRATHFHPLLCQPCNNHQSIIIQLLAAYSDEHCNNRNDAWEQEYKRYKGELERRYPLCMACRVAVSERLKQQDFRLRSFTGVARTEKNARRVFVKKPNYYPIFFFSSLIYSVSMYFLELKNIQDARILITLSTLYLSSCLIFNFYLTPLLVIITIVFPFIWRHFEVSMPVQYQIFANQYRFIIALSPVCLSFILNIIKRKPKIRMQKAVDTFSLSLKDEEEENSSRNQGRNPFFSKTLVNGSAPKSMPASPLYCKNFTPTTQLKPTSLSFKGTSTGLENDFLESFSLSENSNKLVSNSSSTFGFLPLIDFLMRVSVVYLRYLAMMNSSFQALLFAAAYALIFNLDSGLHRRMSKTGRYLISLMCALRLIWLGLDIGQPGWSLEVDNKLNFSREYIAFGFDAFLLLCFSTK